MEDKKNRSVWTPSPKQIKRECRRIRRGWSRDEERRRQYGCTGGGKLRADRWRPPTYRDGLLEER